VPRDYRPQRRGEPSRSRVREIAAKIPNLDLVIQDRARVTIGYIGIIGDQDGVEMLVRAIGALREQHGISNFICRIVGDGPSYETVKI